MQGYVDAGEVSGIVTTVMRRGKIVHLETVGHRDIERKLPMERDTIFRIYSMAKPITSAAVMALYEEGHFELTDPVADYLPEFADLKVYASGTVDSLTLVPADPAPTIQDLIRHTSGLTYPWGNTVVDSLYRAADLWDRDMNLQEFVAKAASLPLQMQPATEFHYSISIDILGYLVQVVSGQPFDEFLEERFFDPLQMDDTGFHVPAEKLGRFAQNYNWSDEGRTLTPVDEGDPPFYTVRPKAPSGGGGLVSTVDDYLRFCQMILNEGELDGQRVLMPATVRFMLLNHLTQEQQTSAGSGFGVGFGIALNLAHQGRIGSAGEASWGGAANTFFWIDPKEEMAYMVWTQLFPPGIRDFRHQMHPLVHSALLD